MSNRKNCEPKDLVDLISGEKKKDSTTIKQKNYTIILLPVVTSNPSTGIQYGLAGQIVFKGKGPEAKTSLISANALYTTKQQVWFKSTNNVYLKNNTITPGNNFGWSGLKNGWSSLSCVK